MSRVPGMKARSCTVSGSEFMPSLNARSAAVTAPWGTSGSTPYIRLAQPGSV